MTVINRIWKKRISILLTSALILTGLFYCPETVYADETVLSDTIYYHLDMGVQVTYQGEEWEERGLDYGDTENMTATVSFPNEVEVLDAYPLESGKGHAFDFSGDTSSTNIPNDLKKSAGGSAANAYNHFYMDHTSTTMTARGTPSADGNDITFSYRVFLNTTTPLDVVYYGYNGWDEDIWKLFGGKNDVYDPDVKDAIENALLQGRNKTAGDNRMYLVFCPTVIEYKKYVTIGDLEAALELPETAKQGEEYTVSDASLVDGSVTIDYAVLEKRYGAEGWEPVTIWDGQGIPGENTDGSINESCAEVCTITYKLTVYDIFGQFDTAMETIRITDKRDISVVADLVMPAFTFEGHSFPAQDQSTFEVDGVSYSAARAYAEKIADNSFKANSAYGKVSRLTSTTANVSFSMRGTYTVTLTVNPVSGPDATDTETIEVRKTPYIMDSLSGFQKQNRKQVLYATIATTPGKPITDYTITIKDKKTGDSISLTPDNPQKSNTTIKTRAAAMTQDLENGFAYLTVEFLTKTPSFFSTGASLQDFYYDIYVEDSKGDTDRASKTFAVSPDLPPVPEISIDTAFLRNEGTNTAAIRAEDVTVAADGDSVERKWYYGATETPSIFTDVSTMGGYKKLSFGTDKIVGFNKAGVGRFTAKLDVKEIWTEPTLEEYVTAAEHLAGSVLAYSDVQNVAPIVSLEMLRGTKQEILLLANNDAELQALMNNKTALQQALLANKIDGRIVIKKLVGSTPPTVTGVSQQGYAMYPLPSVIRGNGPLATEMDESGLLAVDSENTYFLTYTWINGNPTLPKTIHALNQHGGEKWSYTTSRAENFSFGQDDTGKYLYLIYGGANQTVLLDKRTGAVAGTINIALSDKVWLSDDTAFVIEAPGPYVSTKNIYAIDLNSLTKVLVAENVSAVSRVRGDLQYITKGVRAVVRCNLDMETLSVKKDSMIETASPGDYLPVCIDSTGKAVLFKDTGTGTDPFRGFRSYDVNNTLVREVPVNESYDIDRISGIFFSLDEKGECNHAVVYEEKTSGTNVHYFKAANLKTGKVALYSKTTDSYNGLSYAGAFESNGTSYYLFNGWYIYPGGADYRSSAYMLGFNGTAASFGGMFGFGLDNFEENIQISDRSLTALHGDNQPGTGYFRLKFLAFPRTSAQEAQEIASRYTDKMTFLGDVNTTADQIRAAVESPKPAVKITASRNGCLTLNNQTLEQGKKYYYDFEIKPLTEGTKDKLTGLTASTGTTTSAEVFLNNTYYVERSYLEDFNDSTFNEFFTVINGGLFNEGYWGADSQGKDGGDDTSAALRFHVPAGKKAIVSFDYKFYLNSVLRANSGIFIDGERTYMNIPPDSEYAYGSSVFQTVLGPGAHEIGCSVNYDSSPWSAMIDNLTVDIVSTTPKTLHSAFTKQNGEGEGWIAVEGAFETPAGTISYGAQASSYWIGYLPYTGTKFYKYSKYGAAYPVTKEYDYTVPAGYFARAYTYPSVNAWYDDNRTTVNTWNCSYSMCPRSRDTNAAKARAIGNGSKIMLGFLQPGQTYKSVILAQTEMSANPNMNPWEIAVYPVNAVTSTQKIAFDNNFSKYYFPKTRSTGMTNLSIEFPKGEYLIKNLRLYYFEGGHKIYLQNEDCEELTDLSKWTLSSGLTASIIAQENEKPDDEYVKIYKKGEKVLYNIFYDDYEEDPSKIGYWIYSHINWPPDPVHPDVGKVLTAPIDRFYLSGKYTVTHWEVDNTQRPGTAGDATPYNKESNKAILTFYVDGTSKAPWITYIKTDPPTVRENSSFTLAVGVDDTEKDILTLETEVYLNGKTILTDTKTNITAGAGGEYPEQTISGLSKAQAGVYQVVCTVSDNSGTGIKAHKFTVVSEGRVEGAVNHTDQWDANRKKYNLKRFQEEVNRPLPLNDYLAMSTPRMRGTNIFWSGEKFMLRAETEGEPSGVKAEIFVPDSFGNQKSTGYSAVLTDTGRSNGSGAGVWEGSLWHSGMINRWGRKAPEELHFLFTATYAGGVTKTHTVSVIVDSDRDYWQLHRLW